MTSAASEAGAQAGQTGKGFGMEDEIKAEAPAEENGEAAATGREKAPRRKKAAIAAACAAAAALAVAGVAWAATHQAQTLPADEPAGQEQAAQPEQRAEIELEARAEGWSESSTPAIAHVKGQGADFYHAMPANSAEKVEVPAQGGYEVEWISPVNADGSLYRAPAKAAKAEAGGDKSSTGLELVPADQVTQADIDEVMDKISEAVSKGDSTLAGDAGRDLVDKAAANAANAPAADKSKVEEKAEGAKDSVSEQPAQIKPEQPSQPERPSQAAGGSSASSERPSAPSQPAAERKWVADYEQVWVPNYVTVTDQAAWDEQVPVYGYSERSICNTCGADVTGNEAAHGKQHAMNGQNAGHHSEVVQTITGYNTVHHDAVTHVEDQGHWETRESGGHWE